MASSGIHELNTQEKLELARALFQRDANERYQAALSAFRFVYPNAPEEMIQSAVHHVYTDGVDSLLGIIAASEMFLRDPREDWIGFVSGLTFEALYHMYNWHMFQYLLPEGKQEVIDALQELEEDIMAGKEAQKILTAVRGLRDLVSGVRDNPDFGFR